MTSHLTNRPLTPLRIRTNSLRTRTNLLRTRISRCVCGCAFLLMLVASSQPASAEFFQFSTIVNIGALPAGSTLVGNNTNVATITTPANAIITLTMSPSLGPDNIDGSGVGSDIVFSAISAATTRTSPLENISIPYSFQLKISDFPTNFGGVSLHNGTFNISGILTGTVGATGGGKKVNIQNQFLSITPASQAIGNEFYAVSSPSYVPPGPTNNGAFGLHVSSRAVPEPGTMALLGTGLIALATPAYRRSRRKTPSSSGSL